MGIHQRADAAAGASDWVRLAGTLESTFRMVARSPSNLVVTKQEWMAGGEPGLLEDLAAAAGFRVEAGGELPLLRYVRAVRPGGRPGDA